MLGFLFDHVQATTLPLLFSDCFDPAITRSQLGCSNQPDVVDYYELVKKRLSSDKNGTSDSFGATSNTVFSP